MRAPGIARRRFAWSPGASVRVLSVLAVLAASPSARGDDPAPSRVSAAAEEYDRGRRAFLAKSYEQAAVHFENAFRDAPRAEALRNAIRARSAAGQADRAATLAALAAQRYTSDAQTMALAKKTLDETKTKLFGVVVRCKKPCSLIADGRVAPSGVSTEHQLFVMPGEHELSVSFSGGATVARRAEGEAATSKTLEIEEPPPPKEAPPPPPTPKEVTPPLPDKPVATKPLGPVVFWIGAGLTVGAGAATVISGIDARNNPGVDAVRRECAGKDESCPLYQDGKSAELRTNVLLGVTAGLGLATAVVGLFFTQWSASSAPDPKAGGASPRVSATPYVSSDGVGVFGRF